MNNVINISRRRNFCRERPLQQQIYRPSPIARPPTHSVGHSVGHPISYNRTLITPSRSVQVRYVTPKSRPKIGHIDRLAETARKVFDHNFDEEEDEMSPAHYKNVKVYKNYPNYGKSRYVDESDSDCEVMFPEDVDSEGSSESDFSHRPLQPSSGPLVGQTPPGLIQSSERKYTADDFLAEPSKSGEKERDVRPRSRLGYNPLGASRGVARVANSAGKNSVSGRDNSDSTPTAPSRVSFIVFCSRWRPFVIFLANLMANASNDFLVPRLINKTNELSVDCG